MKLKDGDLSIVAGVSKIEDGWFLLLKPAADNYPMRPPREGARFTLAADGQEFDVLVKEVSGVPHH